ncbi:YifB family Mg chelatase-like AAA ATPase [Glutamicibacter protophormiae]|uniref:Competence protein ComM n=1 Tax=Kocuria varians TaxID=1272 RepID=A0A7D7Q8M5_KOCVA|nr:MULTISPECIES: YifB family Mg chelatase-like AAA ATPase [Kocuria]MDN5631995.1 YifB family Mg chelatase-like AAA ATPase [Kocuria sp.]QMS57363.1 Competence protein ComM [Kocuria varians]WNB89509.1 YifB family Mg chelatase-like AAA ATPase [Glutamicibacter protophormiae]
MTTSGVMARNPAGSGGAEVSGFARSRSVALVGLDGHVVDVEVDIGQSLPAFTIIGLPDQAVNESKERIRSAARHAGVPLAPRKITVNLSPATLPKRGSHFDAAVVMAVLSAQGVVRVPPDTVFYAELGLDGSLRPVRGVLPAVLAAVRAGITRVVVAEENRAEAELVAGASVSSAHHLAELLVEHGADPALLQRVAIPTVPRAPGTPAAGNGSGEEPIRDLRDVVGQVEGRQALEIAAAGGHHLLMVGPPGAGKTMLAERLPGILPDLGDEDSLEVTSVHSLRGDDGCSALVRRPPFQAPHHSITLPALCGGGSGMPRPGAISLAHRGVLFLDEAPEFDRRVLDALRQPLESGTVTIARAQSVAHYPARFQLVLAANPCACGNAGGTGQTCTCSAVQRRRYFGKLSGPLLDRVDLQLRVPAVTYRELSSTGDARPEDSATVAARVLAARAAQAERLAAVGCRLNSTVPGSLLHRRLSPGTRAVEPLRAAMERRTLTARGFVKVLRVAWTLADLAGSTVPTPEHVQLALYFKTTVTA